VVLFPQVCPPKSFVLLSFPPYVLHAPPISFFTLHNSLSENKFVKFTKTCSGGLTPMIGFGSGDIRHFVLETGVVISVIAIYCLSILLGKAMHTNIHYSFWGSILLS
jgi:hypothetical protein